MSSLVLFGMSVMALYQIVTILAAYEPDWMPDARPSKLDRRIKRLTKLGYCKICSIIIGLRKVEELGQIAYRIRRSKTCWLRESLFFLLVFFWTWVGISEEPDWFWFYVIFAALATATAPLGLLIVVWFNGSRKRRRKYLSK